MVGWLGAWGGRWGAEMGGKFPPKWENLQDREDLRPREPIPEGFLANKMHRIHGEHVLDVGSSTGVAGTKGWPVGC